MSSIRIDYTNKRFGKLTGVCFDHISCNHAYWKFKCDCGNEKILLGDNVKTGKVKSCGCLLHKPAHNRKHNMSKSRLYHIWSSIKQRTNNKNSKSYNDYGGRGIKVCKEWLNNFSCFYDWSIKNGYSDNLTIDRIDNNKGYYPENCRWATAKQQNSNRRNVMFYTFDNKTMTLIDWSIETGIKTQTLRNRLKQGWCLEKAFTYKRNLL